MANELNTTGPSGLHLDAYVYDDQERVWRTDTHVFEDAQTGNWTHYAIAMSESAAGQYTADFPSQVTALNEYVYVVRVRLGVNAAVSDGVYASGTVDWQGTASGTYLTNRGFVKLLNGWGDGTYDGRIDELLPVVTSSINTFCGRSLIAGDHAEVRNGQGTDWIRVWNPPINSVATVVFNYNGSNPATVNSDQFVWDSEMGVIKFKPTATVQYGFGVGFQNVQINYNGGYNPVPSDVQAAAALLIRNLIEMGDDNRLVTEKQEGNRRQRYGEMYGQVLAGQLGGPLFVGIGQLLQPYVDRRCH